MKEYFEEIWADEENRKRVLISGGVLALILLVLILFLAFGASKKEAVTMPRFISVPTPMATPTVEASPTQATLPGNLWSIVSDVDADGVATFTSVKGLLAMRAQCQCRECPEPELYHQYVLGEDGLLVPIEGADSPLQKFKPLD